MAMKLPLDIALLVLFGVICNASMTGTQFHEIAGLFYIALIVAHLVLNRQWIGAAFKGKLRGKRSTQMAAINIALFVVFLGILVTGILGSHYLFPAEVKRSGAALVVHAGLSVVAAFLVLAHVLLHIKVITKNKTPRKIALAVLLAVTIGFSVFGGIRGALHHGVPKSDDPGNHQGSGGSSEPKQGETTKTP